MNPQSVIDTSSPMLIDAPVIATDNSQQQQPQQQHKNSEKLKEYNLDGLNCSICIEPWTLNGHHQVSSLPCGHLFGLSCIKKWIQLRANRHAKCPQCNASVRLDDVRKLYASPVVLVNENQPKKDETSKAAFSEAERTNLHLIQDCLLKELNLLKKQASARIGGLVHETEKGVKHDVRSVNTCGSRHCSFVLKNEMYVDGAQIFDMDVCYGTLLFARRLPGMGDKYVLNKINMTKPITNDEIMLPLSTKAVNDLHISPCGRLALLASLEKNLSIISMGGKRVVMAYNLPNPAWSCAWDINNPNYMYAGLQNGMLLVYDMRNTVHPVQSVSGLDSSPMHTIHPFEHDTSRSQTMTQLLTAAFTGPCSWNINSAMERSFRVPELTNHEASCVSLACGSTTTSENIIATYQPKTRLTQVTDPFRTRYMYCGFAPSSMLLVERVRSSFYFKLGSTCEQLGDLGIVKSTIINVENCPPMFAYGHDVSNGLKLLEIPSLAVAQNLKPHRHPILDVKYSQSLSSCVLGCISQSKLQLFSAKVS
ncbi:uncharacterized protein [Rutidosis leptorrhynchoides]